MMIRMKLGLLLNYSAAKLEVLVDLVQHAECAGFDAIPPLR